jgi:anti-sigma factor RsiW/cytoskeletal protein CcmA (bactofilin family)
LNDTEMTPNNHLDEMTLLLYVERQLDRERAQEVSLHTQTCTRCMTLLRALDRESRLLTRAMLEQDEPFPARLAEFRGAVKRSMQWIWGLVFGLAVLGVYTLYASYIEPWELQLEQAGFGSTNLLSLLVFQGAFWKGWQSMFTLFEVLALAVLAGSAAFAFRKYIRRGSALAMVFASLGLLLATTPAASATEFRKGDSVSVAKGENIVGDVFLTGNHVRVDGTVDGDVFAFGQQLDVGGHVTGDVFCFAQGTRITGQVDGNIRAFTNNITISGDIGRNVLSFNEVLNLDPNGKVGHSLTVFGQTVTLDGKIGRDVLVFFNQATLSGSIGGSLLGKGQSLTISPTAEIDGKAELEGPKPATVSPEAKLASPLQFTKHAPHADHDRGVGYYIWRLIWTAAFVLLGLVLYGLFPRFAVDTVGAGEHYGAAFGLGVLVTFGLPIAAIIACVTIVGLLLGLSTLFLYVIVLLCTGIVVGTIVGQWLLGRTTDYWPLVARMALGVLLVRIVTSIPFIGFWAALAVILWGMGAISLAVYRRLQPVVAPNIPSMPSAPLGNPLPPNTTVGGI